MGIFISAGKTAECVALALAFAVMLALSSYKLTGILQSSGYGAKKFAKWLRRKNNLALGRLVLLSLLCLFSCLVLSLAFSFAGEWAALCGIAGYAVFFVLYIIADRKTALRSPVAKTPRFMRLFALDFLLLAIISYILITLLNFAAHVWDSAFFTAVRYVPLAVTPLLIIPVLLLSNALDKIYETPHNARFLKMAKKKLAEAKLTVVGITGSCGKTSTKVILSEILKSRFRVLSTPRSHNTPMGIALTVNGAELENYDIFIAEMGARHPGDIAELCGVCNPDYSVITGICPQHLETFFTLEAIVKAKGEIIEGTRHCTVIAPEAYPYYAEYPRTLKCDGAENIVCTTDGVEFDLALEKRVHVKSRLLGAHAAADIALAAKIASVLGMTADEIAAAIPQIDYIEHRLQLIKSNGVNILDDGYNSNVLGARCALDVLKLFGGKKTVVTPGLVELGVLEEKENYKLGAALAGLDFVILVGDTLISPVRRGYLDNGGDAEKICVCPTLFCAQEKLKEIVTCGDAVLFLNDLPDVY